MKLASKFSLILLVSILLSCEVATETTNKAPGQAPAKGSNAPVATDITVGFYNVENLFDTEDDADKIDEDFLPSGKYNWTDAKYKIKSHNIAKVINGMHVDILGIAEIENNKVLRDLTKDELFKGQGLKYVHVESPDMRGIDVALIYNPKAFSYVSHTAHTATFPLDPNYTSRDFLVVEGTVKGGESLFIIVNHWPSRRGGQEESEPRRTQVASLVRGVVDDILADHKDAAIIIMGDFNDDPDNKSIAEVLDAQPSADNLKDDGLYNPLAALHNRDEYGTLTYKGKWNLFDQLIISENLTLASNPIQYLDQSAKVYNPEWLRVGFGSAREAPRRAIFRGEFTEKGYSDHFPVYLKLKIN